MKSFRIRFGTAAVLTALLVLSAVGCKDLPGTRGQQGAAIGGLSGAAAGAVIGGSQHRLVGALLGGALGAGGGYLIGANSDRLTHRDTAGAQEAARRAQSSPATPDMARSAATADLNGDGFVTMDEIVAMKQAGLSDQQIVERMRATGQVFELTAEQQNYLRTHGISDYVLSQMPELNREVRDRIMSQQPGTVPPSPTGGSVLGRPPGY